jgi:hypothetical protein
MEELGAARDNREELERATNSHSVRTRFQKAVHATAALSCPALPRGVAIRIADVLGVTANQLEFRRGEPSHQLKAWSLIAESLSQLNRLTPSAFSSSRLRS